jgi:mRNA interferase MazF
MSSPEAPLRGQVFFAQWGDAGEKPVLVVSNSTRNRHLQDVIVARITSAPKPDIPSIVLLPSNEPVDGRIVCDDLSTMAKSVLKRAAGGLSRQTMQRVDTALKEALGIRD